MVLSTLSTILLTMKQEESGENDLSRKAMRVEGRKKCRNHKVTDLGRKRQEEEKGIQRERELNGERTQSMKCGRKE